jgi:hypothetical protein
MNKLLIVGHPSSRYQLVEQLLNDCGMKPALPSRREALAPTEISAILLKAHGVSPLTQAVLDAPIRQIEPGPIWHGMALDLILGNLEQALWGWSDSQSIYLLDYWRAQDPTITFILVYDNLSNVLVQSGTDGSPTQDELEQRVRNWRIYNEALLHFYLRNTERALLVHAQQVGFSVNICLQQVSARISAPLEDPARLSKEMVNSDSPELNEDPLTSAMDLVHQSVPLAEGEAQLLEVLYPIKAFLGDVLTQDFPEAVALYDELQAAASIPLADGAQGDLARQALHAMNSLQGELDRLLRTSQDRQNKLEALLASQERAIEQSNKLELLELQQQSSQYGTGGNGNGLLVERDQSELVAENQRLLEQLHRAQEDMERFYLENQSLKAAAKPQKAVYYGAAERVKRQLSYRLGATMIEKSRSVGGWVSMPWALVRETRRFLNDRAKQSAEKMPPLSAYDDAYEAEHVKKHLSYRLGALLLTNVRSPVGWVKLPFVLRHEIKVYKKEKGIVW